MFRAVDIAAASAPYPGRPGGTLTDPLNANDIRLMLRGGSGSGPGALFEAGSLGSSKIGGLIEGMPAGQYCIQVLTAQGFKLDNLHCEPGGVRANTGDDF